MMLSGVPSKRTGKGVNMAVDTFQSVQESFEIRKAARTSVVFFDVSDRTQIEVTGNDRIPFLHSFTSNDIKRLTPGHGCETFLTSVKGKVLAHVYVFCRDDSIWLDGTPGQNDVILPHLGKYILIEDVQLKSRNPERGELFMSGPIAAQLLQLDDSMAVGDHVRRESEDRLIDLRRVDLLGVPGFLMSIPARQIEAVKQGLRAVGVAEGSRDVFEILRVEAGYPFYGRDITEENLAQEVARTKQCISFNKGCYLGQETIARLDAMGHTNQELRKLSFDSLTVPPPGTVILDEAGQKDLGTITSAVVSPGLSPTEGGESISAIGLLKRIAWQPGTQILLKFADHSMAGRVQDSVG
jgi:folate-binding protein YgfZ